MKNISKRFLSICLMIALMFIMPTETRAFQQSASVQITKPKSGIEIKPSTIQVDFAYPNIYYTKFGSEVWTYAEWETTKNGKYYASDIIMTYAGGVLTPFLKTAGDFHAEGKFFDFKEGGHYTLSIICIPYNSKEGKIDDRITRSAYSGKTIIIDVYEDNNASASFENSSVNKKVGDTFTNKFTTNSNGKVTYKSSDTKVATVDEDGKVIVKGAGSATITASVARTYIYKSITKTYTIKTSDSNPTKEKDSPSLKFANDEITKQVGDDAFTNKLNSKTDGEITYKSSDTKVATVNSNGTVTIKGTGSTTIIASSKETNKYKKGSATYKLIVKSKSNSNEKSLKTPTLKFASASISKKTNDAAFTNKLTSTTDGAITYKSSNTKVATVNLKGTVTIKGTGSTTIIASSEETSNYKSGSASYKLTVSASTSKSSSSSSKSSSSSSTTKKAATLKFASTSVSKKTNDSAFINKLTSTTDGAITYKSSNTKVATVNSNGTVTIKGTGSTTISALSEETSNYKSGSASYTLTVTSPAKANPTANFNSTSITKSVSDGSFVNRLITNSNGQVTYRSSVTSVATVNSNGQVTIVGGGTTYITASVSETSAYNSASASYILTVNKLNPTASFKYNNISRKLSYSTIQNNPLITNSNGAVTYKSSDTSIAGVNDNGEVWLYKQGTVTITATAAATAKYNKVSASYTITIN